MGIGNGAQPAGESIEQSQAGHQGRSDLFVSVHLGTELYSFVAANPGNRTTVNRDLHLDAEYFTPQFPWSRINQRLWVEKIHGAPCEMSNRSLPEDEPVAIEPPQNLRCSTANGYRIMTNDDSILRHDASRQAPILEVQVEIPRGSFFKRGTCGKLDFVSPIPCPFNYGSVHEYTGLEGDLLDAVVLGPRLERGTRIKVRAFGAVGMTDRGLYDDKLLCSLEPITSRQRKLVLQFFRIYARCKWILNLVRGQPGRNACEGWFDASSAIARATPRSAEAPVKPSVRF